LVAFIGDWSGTTDGSTSNEREPSKAECELHYAPKRLIDEREAFVFHQSKLYTSSKLTSWRIHAPCRSSGGDEYWQHNVRSVTWSMVPMNPVNRG
jgi:hypothetical protein